LSDFATVSEESDEIKVIIKSLDVVVLVPIVIGLLELPPNNIWNQPLENETVFCLSYIYWNFI